MGATGAGKTTLVNLITRFYDTARGMVLVDRVNVRNIDKAHLRKHIAVAMQDVFLFSGYH
ncbi:MAG: ATP-binding cassette domain-containing protein [Clostridia bacterium]